MAGNAIGDSVLGFSIDLYRQLLATDGRSGNIFYSPFSISAALSMALAGSRNNTAKEISTALKVEGDGIHQSFSDFLAKLPGYAPDVKLHIANKLYSEITFAVLESYLSVLESSYSTTIESVDFRSDAEKVREAINSWVESVTQSKIKNLLPPKSLNAATALVIVNAIYFKGLWSAQFNPQKTVRYDFNVDSKNTIKVDMMFQKNNFRMSQDADIGVTALEIPYRGDKTSMVILLPDEIEGLAKLEECLTASTLTALLQDLRKRSGVMLYLPKFKLEQTINLKKALQSLGIKDIFGREADLSGISEAGGLVASEVFHKAFVEVNEEGTEAAAATAMVIMKKCAPRNVPCEFIVDHPFMFLIRSHEPEVILFMGSVRAL